jgi:hypothetical protein
MMVVEISPPSMLEVYDLSSLDGDVSA